MSLLHTKTASVAALAAAVVVGSISGVIGALAGTGRHAENPAEAAQPRTSSPALTSEDVAGLRSDMRELRTTIVDLNTRLSRVEGKIEVRP